ncbi:MAG: DUF2490 domain-containing protein [Chitinophagaceae bacterium]
MKKLLYATLFFTAISFQVSAQSQSAGWLATFNTIKTGKKTSIHYDMQFRSSGQWKQMQTMLFRPGLNYHFRKNMTATVGYALIENRRSISGVSGYASEHRIWEQFIVAHPVAHAAVQHRFRLEQRFIGQPVASSGGLKTDEYATANRLRYFFRSIIPLRHTKSFEKGLFAAIQNEFFGNLGEKSSVNGRFFDQNRLYLATGYRISKKIDIEAGYLNQYVNGRNSSFTNTHVAQLALYTRL